MTWVACRHREKEEPEAGLLIISGEANSTITSPQHRPALRQSPAAVGREVAQSSPLGVIVSSPKVGRVAEDPGFRVAFILFTPADNAVKDFSGITFARQTPRFRPPLPRDRRVFCPVRVAGERAGVRGSERARWPPHPDPLPPVESTPKGASNVGERGQNPGKRLAGTLHGVA